jgi:hypothetical protein
MVGTPRKTPKSIAAITAAKKLKQQQISSARSHGQESSGSGDGSNAVEEVVVESTRYEEWMKLATDNVSLLCIYMETRTVLTCRVRRLPTENHVC